MKLCYSLKRFNEFVSLLRIEPFLFLYMFVYFVKKVPTDQLIQDKICLQKYNLSEDYCFRLPSMSADDDYLTKKSIILADVTQYLFYQNIITSVPGIILALFIGSWMDRYRPGKKLLLIAASISTLLESTIILLNTVFYDIPVIYTLVASIPTGMSGGILGCFAAIWSYAASTTPPKWRALRMTAIELFLYAASPSGQFLGGEILSMDAMLLKGPIRNYLPIFMACCVLSFLALIWCIFMVNESRDKRLFDQKFPQTDIEEGEPKIDQNDGQHSHRIVCRNTNDKSAQSKRNSDTESVPNKVNPLVLLFDPKNVSEIWRTCLKKRDHQIRLQIWLLFVSILFYLLSWVAPSYFTYQFSQRVYNWRADTYSNAQTYNDVSKSLVTLTVIPILIKVCKLTNLSLSILGLISYFAQNVIRGVWLAPMGFYVSIPFGTLGSITSIGVRSYLSVIVDSNEIGKVFSLMSAFESTTPLIGAAIFTFVFTATIDTMPGVSFLVTGGLLIISMICIMWIAIKCKVNNANNNC